MKILVHDQEDYDLLLQASEQIHDCHEIDTDNPVANLFIHLYRINTQDENCEEEKAYLAKMVVIDPTVPKVFRS